MATIYCRVDGRGVSVATIEPEDQRRFTFVSDSQDVQAVREHFGNPETLQDFRSFFVEVKDGDYGRVYGCNRCVPRADETVYSVALVHRRARSARQ